MKKNDAFNAGATQRKKTVIEAAIENNFSAEKKDDDFKLESPEKIKKDNERCTMILTMTKEERKDLKSLAVQEGVSMNHFVNCAIDYFKRLVQEGKIIITSHSYREG